jgi:hypothetical protein
MPFSALPLWSYLEMLNLRHNSDDATRLVISLASSAPHASVGGGSGRVYGAAVYGADGGGGGGGGVVAQGGYGSPPGRRAADAGAAQPQYASIGAGGSDEALATGAAAALGAAALAGHAVGGATSMARR